ncbi:hypothetical protein [Acetivibrio cellulolyticus]|uniref:hypothetical protein n=1 Tax=Acetivibrio cellulolyticus TaxID=35830 RepID=UPI0001E2F150|nr:hypothetical protein [Acetivibrio cellulolyticus]
MNIVNEQVSHILYREGKVISQEENTLSIQFSQEYGIKKFVYPDVFEKYLKLKNPEVEVSVLEELKDKQAMLEAKALQERQEYEAMLRNREDKKSKSSTRKKKSPSKSKVAKLADEEFEENDE